MENTRALNKVELEFTLNTSPHLLFKRLSSPSGLSEWFADDVNVLGNIYTFIWNNVPVKAEMLEKKENKSIKFRWLKDSVNPKSFFSFRISLDELTNEVSLQVVEQLDENEDSEESISLWNSQIGNLKRVLGI